MFILSSCVCKSLQCLISALTQGGKGGHLLRLTCSVVPRGGRNTANNIPGVCGEHSQCLGHAGFAPLMECVLSWSTLLRLQVALQGNCPKPALSFVHFPGLSCSGWGLGAPQRQTQLGMSFVPFPGPGSSGYQVLGECTLPRWAVHLITSPVPAA